MLGAATVAGGLNNAYRFTDSRARYSPRLIDVVYLRGDDPSPQIAYESQGGGRDAFARVRGRLGEPNLGGGGVVYEGVTEYYLNFRSLGPCRIL